MKWSVFALAVMIAVCILMPAAGMNPTLSAVGEGVVSAHADRATILVSVGSGTGNMSQDETAVVEKMAEVIAALKAAGVKDEEIMPSQSSGVSSFSSTSKVCQRINNSTVCDNSSLQASALERSAIVKLNGTDQTRINGVLAAASRAGAEAYVAGYSLSDSKAAESRAREKAVANARVNAEALALSVGLRLGKVVDIVDYGIPEAMYEGPFGSSENAMVDVTSYVTVTYELEI
jgi:uncharacterized protein